MKSLFLNVAALLCLTVSLCPALANPTDKKEEALVADLEAERARSFWRYLINSRDATKIATIREDLSAYSTTAQGDARWLGINGTAANSNAIGNVSIGGFTVPIVDDLSTMIGIHQNGHIYNFNSTAVKSWLGLGAAAYLNAGMGSGASTLVQRNGSGNITVEDILHFQAYSGSIISTLSGIEFNRSLFGTSATFNGSGSFGNTHAGTWVDGSGAYARFGHSSFNTSSNYGFLQRKRRVFIPGRHRLKCASPRSCAWKSGSWDHSFKWR
jgi:hypothetical protein